jgi:hypothetical protein
VAKVFSTAASCNIFQDIQIRGITGIQQYVLVKLLISRTNEEKMAKIVEEFVQNHRTTPVFLM